MVFNKIKQILCEEFEIDEEEVVIDADLCRDLDIDEIDIYDLVMSVEDEFHMELPDEALENISTVGDLVKFIEENN
jgi:acyl carrier protein